MKLTLKDAEDIVFGSMDEAKSCSSKALAIIVLDAGGYPINYKRQDGASLFRFDIARAKAMCALGMGVNSREVAEKAANNPVFFSSVASAMSSGVAYSAGGVLITSHDGEILGAIGVSGDTPDMDEQCAVAGINNWITVREDK